MKNLGDLVMAKLPSFDTYYDYASSNYGAHALVFADAEGNRYWFSYKTLVAFHGPNGRRVLKNYWNTTTGKHLNAIDNGNKRERLTRAEFEAAFKKDFGRELKTA